VVVQRGGNEEEGTKKTQNEILSQRPALKLKKLKKSTLTSEPTLSMWTPAFSSQTTLAV
jgi:hypothetical protein